MSAASSTTLLFQRQGLGASRLTSLPQESNGRSRYPVAMKSAPAIEKPRTLIGWRLLALLYDIWPVLAMWLAVAIPFVLVDVVLPSHRAFIARRWAAEAATRIKAARAAGSGR